MPWQAFGFTLLAQLSLGRPSSGFLPSFRLLYAEKLDFRISIPLPHGMLCFEGPGTQVGATWTEKSSPIGPELPRSGKSDRSGQPNLGGRFGPAVGAMETTANHARIESGRSSKSI